MVKLMAQKTEPAAPARVRRPPLWTPVQLPLVEITIYFIIWIAHSLGAIYVAYRVTTDRPVDPIEQRNTVSSPIFGIRMDGGDDEWLIFIKFVKNEYLMALFVHSFFYWLCRQFPQLPHRRVTLVVDALLHVYMFGTITMVKTICVMCLVVFITRRTKSILPAWVIGIGIMLSLMEILPMPFDSMVWYKLASILYTYKIAQLISFCATLVQEDKDEPLAESIESLLAYSFYMPYTSMLIVLYADYRTQYQVSMTTERKLSLLTIGWKAARLIFWACFIEIFYHFCHVHTYYGYLDFIKKLNWVEVVCMAYLVGQLFHVKYVVVFGMPSVFAYFDNMTPPLPPVCISRLALYSQVWRRFDRGLYEFLKTHVYLPLVAPSFSIHRRLGALVASYAFVLAWHGRESKYVKWVTLNGIEVALEWMAAAVYQMPGVKAKIEKCLTKRMQRRVLAFLQNTTTALGIFGIFHFLGGLDVGEHVAEVSWWKYGATLRWQFFYILALGYSYNQCCMQIDAHYDSHAMKWKTE